MTHRTLAGSRIAGIATAAALAVAVVASGTVLAAGGGVQSAAGGLTVAWPATGGEAIPSSTAKNGGNGTWTQLNGPQFTETQIGALEEGQKLRLELPENFEWNTANKTPASITGCDMMSSAISYPTSRTASITILLRGIALGSICSIDFGRILQVRPVSSNALAGTGGTIFASIVDPEFPLPLVVPGNAGTIRMIASAPPPVTNPTITPATGGASIPSSTARVGGSGAWTQLTGPVIQESAIDQIPAGTAITLTLPANFEWNTAAVNPPVVTNCDRTAQVTTYPSLTVLSVTLQKKAGATVMALCRIDFATLLQVRPVNANATGSAGNIAAALVSPTLGTRSIGNAGFLAMVTATPPPVSLTLSVYAPTMNNGAILWGEYVDLTTTATAGTAFQLQVTVDDPAATASPVWETLKDSVGNILTFTTAADGKYTYRYTPVRNYWYRAVSGSSYSQTPNPRVTVRQTIAIRPENSGTKSVSAGTKVTFTATVRPSRPELEKAKVLFQLYKKSGSSWVLSKSATLVIDDDGVASWTVTFSSGSWYVRAQAQPTPVNANSFWSPNQYYSAS
ncbi:MAG: hypothetical protein MUE82_01610 [Chloroflexi bacterium]|jgi:hypothetical protein|nr:hypothetical protein [Chloroflexota bacterium]